MDELVVARHGESEASALGVVGGDSSLTEHGREQARALGARLAEVEVDVCVTSRARRARETAELALAGRDIRLEVLPELGDVDFGTFDGKPLDEYRLWVESHPPAQAAPGGESRVQTLSRFARAFRVLLAWPERRLLVVAHGLTVRALLDERPQPVVAGAAYGTAITLARGEVDSAVERLERWCKSPSW